MFLTKEEEKMASGEYGETIRKSMDILIALGENLLKSLEYPIRP